MPTKKSEDGTYTISIPAIITGVLEVTIEGVTPLIVNRFDPQPLIAPDPGAKKRPRADPAEIIAKKLYPHPMGGYGFPSSGIKIAMVSAGQRFADQKRTELYGVFGIPEELIHIDAEEPDIREDRVVLAGMSRATDVRYRPAFYPWRMTFPIQYTANFIAAEQVINLLTLAGTSVGIGDWRVEKRGSFGQFKVTNVAGLGEVK